MQAPEAGDFYSDAAITYRLPFLDNARHRHLVSRSRMANGQESFVLTRQRNIKAACANSADFSDAYAHILKRNWETGEGFASEVLAGVDYNNMPRPS